MIFAKGRKAQWLIGFGILIFAVGGNSAASDILVKRQGVVTTTITGEVVVYGPVECGALCLTDTGESCQGFTYQPETNVCELHNKVCVSDSAAKTVFTTSDLNTTICNRALVAHVQKGTSCGFGLKRKKIDCLNFTSICTKGFVIIYWDTNLLPTTQPSIGKPADMSSQHDPYDASRGNDGVKWYGTSGSDLAYLFHTNHESQPWWRVDLEELYCITRVYFLNRVYTEWQRAMNIVVTVSKQVDDIQESQNECSRIDGEANRTDNVVYCDSQLIGRFVQLQSMNETTLHLYEVEVYGY